MVISSYFFTRLAQEYSPKGHFSTEAFKATSEEIIVNNMLKLDRVNYNVSVNIQ